jgi:hypothetical protein
MNADARLLDLSDTLASIRDGVKALAFLDAGKLEAEAVFWIADKLEEEVETARAIIAEIRKRAAPSHARRSR